MKIIKLQTFDRIYESEVLNNTQAFININMALERKIIGSRYPYAPKELYISYQVL